MWQSFFVCWCISCQKGRYGHDCPPQITIQLASAGSTLAAIRALPRAWRAVRGWGGRARVAAWGRQGCGSLDTCAALQCSYQRAVAPFAWLQGKQQAGVVCCCTCTKIEGVTTCTNMRLHSCGGKCTLHTNTVCKGPLLWQGVEVILI